MSHLTVCTPTKSKPYFANSLAAVFSPPELENPLTPSPKSHVNFPLLTSLHRGYLNLVVNSTPICKTNKQAISAVMSTILMRRVIHGLARNLTVRRCFFLVARYSLQANSRHASQSSTSHSSYVLILPQSIVRKMMLGR